MDQTAIMLQLENGTKAVNTSAEIESEMTKYEYVAGVEFDLPEVNRNYKNKCIFHFKWY